MSLADEFERLVTYAHNYRPGSGARPTFTDTQAQIWKLIRGNFQTILAALREYDERRKA